MTKKDKLRKLLKDFDSIDWSTADTQEKAASLDAEEKRLSLEIARVCYELTADRNRWDTIQQVFESQRCYGLAREFAEGLLVAEGLLEG
jgi:hypothetical protein